MIFSKSNASGRLRNFGAHFHEECVERLVVSTNPTLLGGDCPTNGWPGANVGTTLAEGAASRALALRCWTRSRVREVGLPTRRGRRAIGNVLYNTVVACCPKSAPLNIHYGAPPPSPSQRRMPDRQFIGGTKLLYITRGAARPASPAFAYLLVPLKNGPNFAVTSRIF